MYTITFHTQSSIFIHEYIWFVSHFTSLHHVIFPHSSQQFCNITTFLVIHNHHQVARWASFAFIFLTDVQLLRNEVLKKWSQYNFLCCFYKFHSSHHATVQCNNSCSNMINATQGNSCNAHNSCNNKTSQELRMLSSVTINCQITKIVMNSGSQLSEL